RDPVAAVELLRRLAFGGVRVYDTGAAWIVPMDQEFAAMAREVLDVQRYPDLRQYPGGPPERPYDAAGWSLPLQMGERVEPRTTPLTNADRASMTLLGDMPARQTKVTPYDAALQRDAAPFDSVPGEGFDSNAGAAAIVPPPGRTTGSGGALLVDPAQNNAFRALNQAWKDGAVVARVGGRYRISGLDAAAAQNLVTRLSLRAERTSAPGIVAGIDPTIRRPRVGLFSPWTGSMDTGWTRWILEQYGFAPIAVRPEDFRQPLAGKIDTLIIADDARVPVEGAAAGRGGRGRGGAIRPEYAYQLTPDDLQRLDQFVRGGGTLVCLSNASQFAIDHFKLPVKNAVANLRSDEFFLRGSIVEVLPDTAHPVMAGMPDKAPVFVDFSPVFETEPGFSGTVIAKYADSGSPLL